MNSQLGADTVSSELIELRRQVVELQQALAQSREDQRLVRPSALGTAQEIERRQQVESALKVSEQRYQSLYEYNPFMYFTLASDGTVLSVNRFGAQQLGYETEELIGTSVAEVFDSSERLSVSVRLTTCATSPYTLFEWEAQKIRKDGTRLWVKERARAIHDPTGTLLILVVCEDITERKRAEKHVQETSRLLHTLVNGSALPLVSLDREARVISWNQAATRLFGWTEQEVLGRELPYVQAGEEATANALWERGLRGELTGPIELRRQRKDGQMLDLLLWPVFVSDEFEQFSLAVGLYVDRSDLKRAEDALRASELRLQRFLAEAPVGLCILDNNWRAICTNRALCELTGYDEAEIIGSTYALYTHPDDLSANIVLTDEFFRGIRSQYTYEKRYIRKSGEIIWVSVKCTRIELAGHEGPLLLAAVQDITERKLAMEEREHLSRDLHDNLLQALYAVGMQLEAGKLAMKQSARRSKTHMSQAITQLNNLMVDVRRFIALLTKRPPTDLDFHHALNQLITSMTGTDQSAPQLDIKSPVLSFITPQLAEQLLNITREALSNSMRHAQASQRWVRLSLIDNSVRLVIGDDGVGFLRTGRRRTGHGLRNMAARARHISGTFALHTAPKRGTIITVDVPLKKDVMYE